MNREVRAFIVDDSATCRQLLRRMLESDPLVTVVGEAQDGVVAVRRIPTIAPDIVLMDFVMAGMDGLTATARLMREHPCPIVIVSELTGKDATLNFRGLQLGALEVLRKPTASEMLDPKAQRKFTRKIRMLAEIPVVTRRQPTEAPKPIRPPPAVKPAAPPLGSRKIALCCVGASTGGPTAVRTMLAGLGRSRQYPILLVQHIARGFSAGLARWLGDELGVPVELAQSGTRPRAGAVYIAPEDWHLEHDGRVLVCTRSGPEAPFCPSVDRLFASVAVSGLARKTVAVLLSGMGNDGAAGLLQLRQAGAWTIAQDEASSVVYGMPKAAANLGAACQVLGLEDIAPAISAIG